MIQLDKTIKDIDNVFYFLDNNKRQAAERLFHGNHQDYIEVWIERTPFKFWVHLDQSYKRRLVTMAAEHYSN